MPLTFPPDWIGESLHPEARPSAKVIDKAAQLVRNAHPYVAKQKPDEA